jgi:hypothetical protein
MKLKGTHLMVDFETLDVAPTAQILSVGLILFNYKGIIRKGYSEFDQSSQEGKRTKRVDTIKWWENTNKEEYRRLLSEGERDLYDWVKVTEKSITASKVDKFWSRGSMDYLILQDLFGNEVMPFWKWRDVRTLDEFGFKMDTNAHNALGDCINQVKYLYKVFGSMEVKKDND